MTKPAANLRSAKSRGQVVLEYILLGLCLCVIALRVTFTEGPNPQAAGQPINLGSNVYSLSVSTVLFLSFVVWLVYGLFSKRFFYRFTAIEAGLCLFILASVISGAAASNRRDAITDFIVLLAPILMAVLLVQILDSHSKIKLVLVVITALGVVSAYQCVYQLLVENEAWIYRYEHDPNSILEPLGIQPGTFADMLFRHRLYSRGIRSFFTTGNSAGSFALLASFAAVALFIDKLGSRKSDVSGPRRLVTTGVAAAVVISGLALTRSKGAIVASVIAAAMFAVYLLFGNRLKTHKRAILVVCLLLFIAGCFVVVWYGLAHDRLPGGNSMLVRWQYWQASARMYADHGLTGVGPGNFVHFYPHYKVASAPETVSDPHNFVLGVLTQYGPLGLVGFLAMIFIPLWRVVSSGPTSSAHQVGDPEPPFKKLAVAFVIVVSAGLLLLRPIVMPLAAGDSYDVMIYAIFTLYVAPVLAFAVGFWLLTANERPGKMAGLNITVAVLSCACLGCLVHNLIDFAIFEPGVFTTFWAIVACLIALDFREKSRPQFVLRPVALVKMAAATGGLILVWAYFNYAFVPTAKATAKTMQAMRELGHAHQLLDQAAEDDPLDPAALNLNGRFYLQHYNETGKRQPVLLERGAECFLAAIERNSAGYKNFQRLAEVYNLLAETSTRQEKTDWLNKAFDSARNAVERYPGSGRLRIELAKVAEQLGKTDLAVDNYREAVRIEDRFRDQFRVMYPGQEVFSRLGEEKYQYAKQQIKQLSGQTTP